jgi:6-phosphogluconolactonase
MLQRLLLLIWIFSASAALPVRAQDNVPACPSGACGGNLVYFGTRASGPGQGIFAARFDATSGHLSPIGLVADIARPTWLIAHQTLPVLYAVSEVGNDGLSEASVFSLAANKTTGELGIMNSVGSGGGGATHLAIDTASSTLFVANYGTGQVSWLPMLPDGRLGLAMAVESNYGTGPHRRQAAPHAHGVEVDPSHRFVLAADLGADRIFVYHFNLATRQLIPAAPAFVSVSPGSGPRHLVFHPNGRFLFVVTELSAQVVSYRWDAKYGHLQHVQTLSVDEPAFTGDKSAAHIETSHDGRYVYVSDRGANSMVVYAVSSQTGKLSEVQRISCGGKTPWSFSFDTSGRWILVANYGSNTIAVFAVDPGTGKLIAAPESLSITQPSNVTFLHAEAQ